MNVHKRLEKLEAQTKRFHAPFPELVDLEPLARVILAILAGDLSSIGNEPETHQRAMITLANTIEELAHGQYQQEIR